MTKGRKVTEWKLVGQGVSQGSSLSPLLFNIFVRHIPSGVGAKYCFQFADDITEAETDKDPLFLMSKLESVFARTKEHCESLGSKSNADKTQIIVFKAPSKKLPVMNSLPRLMAIFLQLF